MPKKILHILPHLGGGVGKVLGSMSIESEAKSLFTNEFVLLDKPQKESIENIKGYSLKILPKEKLLQHIPSIDIVQVNWWNHPVLVELLCSINLPECRLLAYSHISGFYYPNMIPEKLFEMCDKVVASTEFTFNDHKLFKMPQNKEKIGVVHSCSGLSRVANVKKQQHSTFNMGYIGTIDYCKLHPDFIKIFHSANIADKKVLVCGTGNDLEDMKRKTKNLNEFKFLGYVEDIASVLSIVDIFGYPLNNTHYGTGEQVIIEALGAGMPVVVMNNGAEKVLIKDKYNGLIASNTSEFVEYLELLAKDKELRRELGENAKKYAIENFSIENTVNKFDKLYGDEMQKGKFKRIRLTNNHFKNKGFGYFLSSQGDSCTHYLTSVTSNDDKELLAADKLIAEENANYTHNSKGSIFQYNEFFPNDAVLNFWCGLILLNAREYKKSLNYFENSKKHGFKHARIDKYISIAKSI